jgi:hypothetical protein
VYEEPPHGVTRFNAVDVDGALLHDDGSNQKLVKNARRKKTRAKEKKKHLKGDASLCDSRRRRRARRRDVFKHERDVRSVRRGRRRFTRSAERR